MPESRHREIVIRGVVINAVKHPSYTEGQWLPWKLLYAVQGIREPRMSMTWKEFEAEIRDQLRPEKAPEMRQMRLI